MNEISEAEFYTVWGVRPAESGDLLCFDDIRSCPDKMVWTVVESGEEGDGNWYARNDDRSSKYKEQAPIRRTP